MPSLFPKRSRSRSFRQAQAEGRGHATHARKVSLAGSLASTVTRSSTDSHRRPGCSLSSSASFDPLSLHPPLALNTSPRFDEARYREDAEREDRFFNQTRRAEDHIQDSPEYSPVKGENCFFRRDNDRRVTYVYDQAAQWPLKDWQTIPPGLADIEDVSEPATPLTPLTPRPASRHYELQRRPAGWMDDPCFYVKRGDWKRRGIVFHLDASAEEEQEQHFEIEQPFEFPG